MGWQITRARRKVEITNPAAASGAWVAQRGGWHPERQAQRAHRQTSSSAVGPAPWDTAAPHAPSPCGESKTKRGEAGSRKQVSHDEEPTDGRRCMQHAHAYETVERVYIAVVPVVAARSPGRWPRWLGHRPPGAV